MKKRILVSIVVTNALLASAGIGLSQTNLQTLGSKSLTAENSTSQTEKELKDLDAAYFRTYREIQSNGDREAGAAFFERLIANDYFNINEQGNIGYKAQRIANIRNLEITNVSNNWTDMRVRLSGNMALVYSNFSFQARLKGKPISGGGIHAHWYQKREGRWQQVAALVMPPTVEPSFLNKMDVAIRAFRQWQSGWQTGNFTTFLSMTTDNFNFWSPAGQHRGQFSGAEGKARMVAKTREHSEAKDRLTLKPYRITSSGNTVVFEFGSVGMLSSKLYKGRNVISLDIEGDKVSGFREYFGDLN